MTSKEIRDKYREFFVNHGHKWIPSAPLVPENDPTTLFTSSGMQPLVPYLLGQSHPEGKRLANSQPCFRSQDIEEVGDNRHTTFFEMLGNWSLGNYFKKEQLPWFWEFLTEELKLDPNRLYVTLFEGDNQVSKDTESEKIWKSLGVSVDHIRFYGVKNNWWSRSGAPEQMPPGEIGGPDSEVFYEFTQVEHDKKYGEKCHPNCDCGRFLEIGNSVFIQYQKQEDGTLKELPNKNVDFGGGLERLTAATMDEPDMFRIDLFNLIIKEIEKVSGKKYGLHDEEEKKFRIIADHIRAAAFIVDSGIEPSNQKQGYVLRRLIRRSVVVLSRLMDQEIKDFLNTYKLDGIVKSAIEPYINKAMLKKNFEEINGIFAEEWNKFKANMNNAYPELMKIINKPTEIITGEESFYLFETHGILSVVLEEVAQRYGKKVDWDTFRKLQIEHQELSRTASAGMFKGGLADHSEITTKYHTATHLLHAALRKILGDHVQQKGSNITTVRLRFDFSHPQKTTEEELKKVENLVNEQIGKNLAITSETMNKEDALKSGALGFFAQKYSDKVTVYSVGSFSKEICGGPHVDFTGKLGTFRIEREESAGSGIRRIYAIVGGK